MQLFSTMLLHPLKAGGHALYVHLTACQAHQLIQPVEIVSARRRTQPLSACRGQKHLRCSTASFVASANQRPPFTEQKVSVDSAVWSTMSPALDDRQCSMFAWLRYNNNNRVNKYHASTGHVHGPFYRVRWRASVWLALLTRSICYGVVTCYIKKKHIAVFVSSDCTHRT